MSMATRYASVVDLLLDRLTEHEVAEAGVLRDYEDAATASTDPAVRFLMNLILQDEKRHHGWMGAAARSLFELRRAAEATSLPVLQPSEDKEQLLAQTEAFLDAEKQALHDVHELEQTLKWAQAEDRALYQGVELSHSPTTSAWIKESPLELLVEMMREDTQRHIRILENIKRRLHKAAAVLSP
jgi:hypothetical protein